MSMNRRDFLKSLGLYGGMGMVSLAGWPLPLRAAGLYDQLEYTPVGDGHPQIINIFLYGAPSELAGNLSNIGDIMLHSQNAYPAEFDPGHANTQVTPNAFWKDAGGEVMEALLASGDMSIYRTLNRIKDQSKTHEHCVSQNLAGSLDTEAPGFAASLSWILQHNNPFAKPLDELVLPFVSFEGNARVFSSGELEVPVNLRPLSLDSNLVNPYGRTEYSYYTYLNHGSPVDLALQALSHDTNLAQGSEALNVSFDQFPVLAEQMDALLNLSSIEASIADYNTRLPTEARISYGTDDFSRRLKAAVSLALNNRESLFISVGSSGLGGWDDHSGALNVYPPRMNQLMSAIQAGIHHLNAAHADAVNPVGHADKVIINVFGDFGRNVNLNNALGWDHGNNQNFYTFGGRGISGRSLGKIVGHTERIGDSGVNRQFTNPAADSYQIEPYAIASSIYRAFGVTNPEVLTGESPIDENVEGEPLAG